MSSCLPTCLEAGVKWNTIFTAPVMSASVTCHLPRRVGLSGNCKRPPEGDLFFEPLRPPSFTDSPTGDEDDAVSQSSVDGSFLSRQSSDGGFVLAADLSSSESDAFVSSTPGASDTEGRHEHLVDLRNLFTRSGKSQYYIYSSYKLYINDFTVTGLGTAVARSMETWDCIVQHWLIHINICNQYNYSCIDTPSICSC